MGLNWAEIILMISDKKSVDSKFNNRYLASSLKWLNTIAWLVLDSIG